MSITLEAEFCIDALKEAVALHGRPEIVNSDQSLPRTPIRGKPIHLYERLWRTIKYEEVYLRAYANVPEARASIGRYVGFFNERRPHSSLGGKTPDQAYTITPQPIPVAA